jgi:hypothetical protein
MLLQSTITCPECSHASSFETMPTDACQYSYDSKHCGYRMKPKRDCCIYCSYGSVPCPPIQEERAGRRSIILLQRSLDWVRRATLYQCSRHRGIAREKP